MKMNKSEIIERLRVVFAETVADEEDSEYDEPEDLTGEVIDFVKYRGTSNESFLHLASLTGKLEAAKLLIELGIDIDLLGDMSNTALHYAAQFENFDIYDYLVSKGASEGIVNEFGKTPKQYKEEKHKQNE